MSKSTIIDHIAGGQYNITLHVDNTRLDGRLAFLQAEIPAVEANITAQKQVVDDLAAELATAVNALNTAIILFNAGDATIEDVEAASANVQTIGVDLNRERLTLATLQAKLNALFGEQRYLLNNRPDDETVTAWCADLSEDLAGDIGTLEIPGERKPGDKVHIRAGFANNAVYDPLIDGIIQHTVSNAPIGTYWNISALPGWQKWRPTYRYGTVTMVNGDLCNVDLDAAISSQQKLNVNQAEALTDIPIEYMDCNGAVFEANDRVLVKFENQNWNTPKVIGFIDNPKECRMRGFMCLPASDIAPDGWGKPFEDGGGQPINPPLGTTGGTDPENIIGADDVGGPYTIERSIPQNLYANTTYYGNTRNYSILGPTPRTCHDTFASKSRSDDIFDRGEIFHTDTNPGNVAGLSEVIIDGVRCVFFIKIRTLPEFGLPGTNRRLMISEAYILAPSIPDPVLVDDFQLNFDVGFGDQGEHLPIFEAHDKNFVASVLVRREFNFRPVSDWSRIHTVRGTITRNIDEFYSWHGDEPVIDPNRFLYFDVVFLRCAYIVPTKSPNESFEDLINRITVNFTVSADSDALDRTISDLTYNMIGSGTTTVDPSPPNIALDVYDTLTSSYDYSVSRDDSYRVYIYYDPDTGLEKEVIQQSTLNGVVDYDRTHLPGQNSIYAQTTTFTMHDSIEVDGVAHVKIDVSFDGTAAEDAATPAVDLLRGIWSFSVDTTVITEVILYYDARIKTAIISRVLFTANLATDNTDPNVTIADLQALSFDERIILVVDGVETELDAATVPYEATTEMATSWDDFMTFYNMPPAACISMQDAVTNDSLWDYSPAVGGPFDDTITLDEQAFFKSKHLIFPVSIDLDNYVQGGAGWRIGYKEIPFDGDRLALVGIEYWKRILDYVHEVAVAVGVSQWPDQFTVFRPDPDDSRIYEKFAPFIRRNGSSSLDSRMFVSSLPDKAFSVDRHGNYFFSFESPITPGKWINLLSGSADVDVEFEVQYSDKDSTTYVPVGLV